MKKQTFRAKHKGTDIHIFYFEDNVCVGAADLIGNDDGVTLMFLRHDDRFEFNIIGQVFAENLYLFCYALGKALGVIFEVCKSVNFNVKDMGIPCMAIAGRARDLACAFACRARDGAAAVAGSAGYTACAVTVHAGLFFIVWPH